MTYLDYRRRIVHRHLETAIRLQRKSWDAAQAAEDNAGNQDLDIYALVSELAGGLADDEVIPDELVDLVLSPCTRMGFANDESHKLAKRPPITIRQVAPPPK